MSAVISAPDSSLPRITTSLKLAPFICSWNSYNTRKKSESEKQARQEKGRANFVHQVFDYKEALQSIQEDMWIHDAVMMN